MCVKIELSTIYALYGMYFIMYKNAIKIRKGEETKK